MIYCIASAILYQLSYRALKNLYCSQKVCDCDFSEELALPRHRIQYFSYKGQRVWDRDSRTDRVFGSTGQTIVPPFASENQQGKESYIGREAFPPMLCLLVFVRKLVLYMHDLSSIFDL